MAKKAQATVTISAQNKMKAGLQDATKELGNFGKVVEHLGKLTIGAGIGLALKKIGDAAKYCVGEFAKIEPVQRKLTAALGQGTKAYESAQNTIAKYSKQTLQAGDDVTALVAKLAQLGKSAEEIDDLTHACVALSNVTGNDLNSSLGNLLDSLNGEVGELKKFVPELTHMSKEALKAGDGIQHIINKFGKLSEEVSSDSFAQTKKNIEDSWSTISQSVGSILKNELEPVFKWAEEESERLANKFAEWAAESDRRRANKATEEATPQEILSLRDPKKALSSWTEEQLLNKYTILTDELNNATKTWYGYKEFTRAEYQQQTELIDLIADVLTEKGTPTLGHNHLSQESLERAYVSDDIANQLSNEFSPSLLSMVGNYHYGKGMFQGALSKAAGVLGIGQFHSFDPRENLDYMMNGGPFNEGVSKRLFDKSNSNLQAWQGAAAAAGIEPTIIPELNTTLHNLRESNKEIVEGQREQTLQTEAEEASRKAAEEAAKAAEEAAQAAAKAQKELLDSAQDLTGQLGRYLAPRTDQERMDILLDQRDSVNNKLQELISNQLGDSEEAANLQRILDGIDLDIDDLNLSILNKLQQEEEERQKLIKEEADRQAALIKEAGEKAESLLTSIGFAPSQLADTFKNRIKPPLLSSNQTEKIENATNSLKPYLSYVQLSNEDQANQLQIGRKELERQLTSLQKAGLSNSIIYKSIESAVKNIEKQENKLRSNSIGSKLGDKLGESWNSINSDEAIQSSIVDDLASSLGELYQAIQPIIEMCYHPWWKMLAEIVEGFVNVIAPAITETIQPFFDALNMVGQWLGELLLPIFDALYPYFLLIAQILQTIVAPVLQIIAPFLQIVSLLLDAIRPILVAVAVAFEVLMAPVKWLADLFSWFGDWIKYAGHCIDTFVHNLAHPFRKRSYGSSPGRFKSDAFSGLDDRISKITDLNDNTGAISNSVVNSNSTQTAVQGATYNGAMTVTINNNFYAPVVGEDGMDQFAIMIRTKFEELEYFGN